MSKIEKLGIMGIRSFDNYDFQYIKCLSPLTLIVGYNGSGKTTVIECLKYATTGDLPPNSKGGAFIHDPKLCGEREVKAAVKLSFRTSSGALMTISRGLQLTVKKTARSMKTLECSLSVQRDAEKIVVSTRVADLDRMVPEYLGVSKAIIDNVIFCHQDESLWPLSEPSVLKKKFDEIFEAQKYTKAIDNIKLLRKSQNEDLARLRNEESQAKTDKDRGAALEANLRQLRDQTDGLREQVRRIDGQMQVTMEEWSEASDKYSTFQETVQLLELKRNEARYKQEGMQEARSSIGKFLRESDDELTEMMERHQEKLDANEGEQIRYAEKYNELRNNARQIEEDLANKRSQYGRFLAEREHYDNQTRKRTTLIKETARSHSMRGFDHDLSRDDVSLFIRRLETMVQEHQAAFQKAESEMKKKLDAAQRHLNALHMEKSNFKSNQTSTRGRITTFDQEIMQLRSKLDAISMDEGMKARIDAAAEDALAQLQRSKQDAQSADLETRAQAAEQKIQQLEEERSKANAELITFNAQSQHTAKIDLLTKTIRDCRRSLETMKGAHAGRLAELLGDSWQPHDIEDTFRQTRESRQKALKDAESQQQAVAREHSQIDFKLRNAQQDLKAKQEAAAKFRKEVIEALDGDDISHYSTQLLEAESNRKVFQSDVDGFKARKDYFEKCLAYVKSKDACRLCKRAFGTDSSARASIVRTLEKYCSDEELEASRGDLQQAETTLKRLQAVSSIHENYNSLVDKEIPNTEKELATQRQAAKRLLDQLESCDEVVNDQSASLKNLESISKTVQAIARDTAEISRCEREIESMTQKQSQSGASGRGLEAIRTSINQIDEEIKAVRNSLSSLTGEEKTSRARITSLENDLRDLQAKAKDAEVALGRKNDVLSRIDTLASQSKLAREELRNLEEKSLSLDPEIAKAQAQVDDIDTRWMEEQRDLRIDMDRLTESNRAITAASEDIVLFESKDGLHQLARSEREIEECEASKAGLDTESKEINAAINKLRDEKQNEAEYQRIIRQNLKYRSDRRSLEKLEEEIEELQQRNAEEDREYWHGEVDRLQAERNKLAAQQAGVTAQMGAKDEEIQRGLRDWEAFYKDAKRGYREAHIKVEATKAAVEDLGRYGAALDKAIMKYHSIKMEEINRLLDELWRRTYRGSDIDTILIRSDSDTGTGARKSYNYRVCMIKQNAEMDMRGRCSAGQKVLASILIRLALAECFGVNCGMIALDEPTTNLDRDNIQSLAESLHDIIKLRRAQSNFQLIVITHDEEFLRFMRCQDFGEHYYRMSRDDNQKSRILRQKISGALE